MDCEQLKIWINKSDEGELFNPPIDVASHIENCDTCKTKFEGIQKIFSFMQLQKQATVSPEQTELIINNLLLLKENKMRKLQKPVFIISRIAAIFIIALGITIGIIVGELMIKTQNTDSNPWDTEFEMLTDNTDYNFNLFE